MSLFDAIRVPNVITYKVAPSRRRLRWLAISAIVSVAAFIGICAAVAYGIRHSDREEASQRAKCLADGGRIVPVHGGKYDAWICDLPRNVEVQP